MTGVLGTVGTAGMKIHWETVMIMMDTPSSCTRWHITISIRAVKCQYTISLFSAIYNYNTLINYIQVLPIFSQHYHERTYRSILEVLVTSVVL